MERCSDHEVVGPVTASHPRHVDRLPGEARRDPAGLGEDLRLVAPGRNRPREYARLVGDRVASRLSRQPIGEWQASTVQRLQKFSLDDRPSVVPFHVGPPGGAQGTAQGGIIQEPKQRRLKFGVERDTTTLRYPVRSEIW